MKKLIPFIVLFAISLNTSAQSVPSGYIDLGLPSGTIWKKVNESGFFTCDQALGRFYNSLPTEEQWEELKNNCNWIWTGNGYRVIGPNHNVIFLPASGYQKCSGNEKGVGSIAYYQSKTIVDEYQVWALGFGENEIVIDVLRRCEGLCVHLIYNGH